MITQHLVVTDVDAIQDYVFSSIRMATIVGASHIVAHFDREVEKIAKEEFQAARAVLSGGNGLFIFDDETKAREFAFDVPLKFREASVNGTLTASQVISFEPESGYPAALTSALGSLDARKRLGRESAETVSVGLAWQCEYCGAESALPMVKKIDDEHRRIGAACLEKLNVRDQKHRGTAQDFNKLAGDDYLAVMVIDGDSLGRRLRELATPQEYEDFSTTVKKCVERAITAGKAVAPTTADSPFQILYQGGDDIVIACQSQWALLFAEAFSASLAQENWDWAGDEGRVGFSIGVSVTNSGFPFRVSHRIANRLLQNAKRVAKDDANQWTEGAIDFAIVTEASGDAETILEDREIGADDVTIRLTGRPYRLAAGKERSLTHLRQACEALDGFASNRLFGLRNELTRSRLGTADSAVIVRK